MDPAKREKLLRQLYRRTGSEMLRGVIMRRIAGDPLFLSRQARFIRRWGFYANWFNRLMFTAVRVVQGNIQAIAQLAVQAGGDLWGTSQADASDRIAYDLLRRSTPTGPISGRQWDQIENLRQKVERAQGHEDLARARWALEQGDPEAAAFYAAQASQVKQVKAKALRTGRHAEAEAAARRRRSLASQQVGYPDATPPVTPASSESLRALLSSDRGTTQTLGASDGFIAQALDKAKADPSGAWLQGADGLIAGNRQAPASQKRWIEALALDPAHNPVLRMNRAQSQRSGQLWHFIFVGPQEPCQRVIEGANWLTQALDAIQNVGLFYAFDVLGRAGQAFLRAPAPDEEYIDAQAAWLAASGQTDPKRANQVARSLAKIYVQRARFDDARAVLRSRGLLDSRQESQIARSEARNLLATAEKLAPGSSQRQALIDRVLKLAPTGALAKRANKLAAKKPPQAASSPIRISWATLAQWTSAPPPCGLPGAPEWFDADKANGQILNEDVRFEPKDGSVIMSYFVEQQPGDRRLFQTEIREQDLPERIRQWLRLTRDQFSEADRKIQKLDRLPIPFELEGGLGGSGIDFYPKLLPIETQPGQIDLYQSSEPRKEASP